MRGGIDRGTATAGVDTAANPAGGDAAELLSGNCVSMRSSRYRKETLDSLAPIYRDGFGDETCVFPLSRQGEYDQAWMTFIHGLAGLDEAEGITSLGVYAHFAPDGRVEHLFYKADGVDEERFQQGVQRFCDGFRFPLEAPARFKQCSSVEFKRR